jgi:hypothetical protein
MLSLIPTRMRVLYVLIAAAMVLSAIIAYPQYGISPVATVMAALSLLAASYEERWALDENDRNVTFRHGLVFLAKRKKIPYAEIAEVRVETFEKGFRKASWTRVSFAFADGRNPLVVETMPTRKAAKLTAFAERVRGSLRS